MFLRPLSFFLGLLVFVSIAACGGATEEDQLTTEAPQDNHWTDSIYGSLSAEQQYYQHLIIEVPTNYQLNLDSLTSWIVEKQPGGLKLVDWDVDSISMLKNRLDTTSIIQPFLHTDYFSFLGLRNYPYWEANEINRDLKFTRVFQKAGMNLLDFESNVSMTANTVSWMDSMKSKQAIYPITSHYSDKFVKRDFNDFMLSMQRYDHNIVLDLNKFDTVALAGFRKSTAFEGLFLVNAKNSSINQLMDGGADFLFKSIETADKFSEWKTGSEAFENSTRRILDYKSEVEKRKIEQHLEPEVKYTSLNLVHNAATAMADASKMLPFKSRFALHTWKGFKLSTKIKKESQVSLSTTDFSAKSIKKIAKGSGNKVIVLPDSVSQDALDALAKIDKASNTLICFTNPAHYSSLAASANLMFLPVVLKESGDILVQQLSRRLVMDGSFVKDDSVYSSKTLNKAILARTIPEYQGYDTDTLNRINWAVKNAMNGRAFPGCQVLLAKNGCIIYDKQFGHHSYKREKVVTEESLYDLASITKVLATTIVGMKLWEMGKYDLKDSLQEHLPDSLKNYLPYPSTIRNITFHELFIHKSGLPAGFPLIRYLSYKNETVGMYDRYFCDISDTAFCIEVAENFYLEREYGDSMWLKLNQMWLDKSKPYKYSDVNMNTLYYMLKGMIDKSPRDFGFTEPAKKLKDRNLYVEYLNKTFYEPLGMSRTGFKPLDRFSVNGIVPTENETYWRKQLLRGHVHDPNSALMGGIAGNAGLFSTTNDMAKLCQMLLDKGVYDNQRFLNAETVTKFTSVAEDSHRGLGFNKRTISTTGFGMADSSSIDTYGHTGFTGTCFWIDPQEDLVYIFLSNRVHPKVNNRIYQFGIRKRIHNAAYDARLNY